MYLLHVGKLTTYETTRVSHQEVEDTQYGRDNSNTVMKASESYRKFNLPKQILAERLDTDNNIGVEVNEAYDACNTADTQRNEAYGVLDSAHDQQHEVGYATIT